MEKLIILKWFLKCLQMRKKCYQNGYIQILKKQQQNIPNSDVMKSELWELDPSLPNLSERKKNPEFYVSINNSIDIK